MKMIHRGQKGLTLIELLIVIAILGIIAAVIIPNIAGFITSGNVAAANTELENVKTGSLGYYATFNDWPATSGNLTDPAGNVTPFVSGVLGATYTFDTAYGWVLNATLEADGWEGIVFVDSQSGNDGWHGHWAAAS